MFYHNKKYIYKNVIDIFIYFQIKKHIIEPYYLCYN